MTSKFSFHKNACLWLLLLLFLPCNAQNPTLVPETSGISKPSQDSIVKIPLPKSIRTPRNVDIENYFSYIDSLVTRYDSLVPYPLSEHLLIKANPWVIDTLSNTDYYRMIERDSFVYNQKKLLALPEGSVLNIPDSLTACKMVSAFDQLKIDVNLPEFLLRIYQDTVLLHTFPIRVGMNAKRYLAMGDRVTDLKTEHGTGTIIKHIRNPKFYNPVDGKQFFLTKRDDEKTTLMPQIPWIETEINGVRNGQLIHPTTNPKSLGQAYSNGCIGTKEADAWVIYYHAPLGTPIHIRYNLKIRDKNGQELVLKDIYGYVLED